METFKRLKNFYWPYKHYFIWSLVALLFATALTVVHPMILQFTIDNAVLGGQYELIPYLAFGLVGVMAVKGVFVYIHQYYGDLFGVRAVYRLRNVLYEKLQFLPFRYYDNAKTGDLMSRLTADVEGFRFFLSFGCAQLLHLVLMVGLSTTVMFYYSVPLTLATMSVIPFLVIVVSRFDKRVHPKFREIRRSMARLNTKVQENVSGMHTVKALSQEDEEIYRFTSQNGDYRSRHINMAKIWGKYFPLMEFIGNMSSVFLLGFGGYLTITGSLQPGELVAFFLV